MPYSLSKFTEQRSIEMAEPTEKAPEINQLLNSLSGGDRERDIRANVCIPKPIGCGGPAVEFRDELSRREYRISGLCQRCQDSVFGGEEE
jgi:hypothetical protein